MTGSIAFQQPDCQPLVYFILRFQRSHARTDTHANISIHDVLLRMEALSSRLILTLRNAASESPIYCQRGTTTHVPNLQSLFQAHMTYHG